MFALHSVGLRQSCAAWVLQVGLSRWIILSNPAANPGWGNLFLPASLSILWLCGAHRVGKKVYRDNGCNLQGLLFVSLSELACWGGTNCRTRLQLKGPHKQSCSLLKLNSLIRDLGTAGMGRRGNTYPTVVAVRMAEWPEGSRHRFCSQLYFLLDVSCGHLTKSLLGLKFVSYWWWSSALRHLEGRKCKNILEHLIIKYRTRQTPLNFIIIQVDKYRAGCTEFLLCFPSENITASDTYCGMRNKKRKG